MIVLSAYFLGSIPTGYLLARFRGVDIRQVGSGNIGATNVFRILGKSAGTFVLLADALKGFVACYFLGQIIEELLGAGDNQKASAREYYSLVAGIAAILGHNYTCWLKFKGGKGIATSAGVLIALVPWALLTILAIWIVVFATSRFVSLASISASFSLPFAVWLTGGTCTMVLIMGGVGSLAIYKHKMNIRRLLQGTEPKIGAKKTAHESTT
jgi:acyl phosphate:glycerol-3-phosphate acyltransferase